MKKLVQILTIAITTLINVIFSLIVCCYFKIPGNFVCFANEFPKNTLLGMNFIKNQNNIPTQKNLCNLKHKEQFKAILFNLFPVKNVNFQQLGKKIYVSPCGTPFGLKILTDGVLIVDIQKVKTKNGEVYPAKLAGLKKGDFLISVNDCKITNNSQLEQFVIKSKGKPLKFKIKRNDKEIELKIKPVFSIEHGVFTSGIWVRDSSAGIGTLTFSTQSGFFGGLGHAVVDLDTGNNLTVGEGEIVEASIYDIVQGNCSQPGELKGDLKTQLIGKIIVNTECGLYGILDKPLKPHDYVPLGLKHEIKLGPAYIYSTIKGNKSEKFKIQIESIDYNHDIKNFVIKIVDENLLNQTGGIVQGMSGSPIIQNGKFIGAITHVFLNDAKRGYGVFAENMLMTARQTLKNL